MTRWSLKRHDMSQHDLVSAQNHAEDMVAPLTADACITRHETCFGLIVDSIAFYHVSMHVANMLS